MPLSCGYNSLRSALEALRGGYDDALKLAAIVVLDGPHDKRNLS